MAQDKVALVAGTVLLRVMPMEALAPVAERLSEPAQVEEFLWDNFEDIGAAQYMVIVAERSPELRQLLLQNFTAYSVTAAEWIRSLLPVEASGETAPI